MPRSIDSIFASRGLARRAFSGRKSMIVALLRLIVAAASAAVADDYKAPRTHDGHPSLEGHWTI